VDHRCFKRHDDDDDDDDDNDDNDKGTCVVIDVSGYRNVIKKEAEKILKTLR
jgi:hypothetical protein